MRLNTKFTTERLVVTFNFSKVAATIGSPVVQVFDLNNVEQPGMIFGPPQIVRNRVTQLIEGGVGGTTYKLICTVQVPATNETLVARGSILVQNTV